MTVKDIFQPDNLFSEVMTKIFDILLLNLLWLLCSLPAVTFGASTTALYAVMMKLVRGEENGIVKSFSGLFGRISGNRFRSRRFFLSLGRSWRLIFMCWDGQGQRAHL